MMKMTVSPEATTPIPRLLRLWVALVAFMTYLTGVGLVPGVANNIGPFEVLVGLLIMVTLAYFLHHNLPVYSHFTVRVLLLIVLLAAVDLLKMSDRPFFGVTQWLLLVYAVALLLTFYNWFIRYPDLLRYLLRFLSYAVVVAALWVVVDGFLSGGNIDAAGPFRNRVHVGIYLLSSFWIVLIYLSYPGVSARERTFLYLCIPVILYGIAVSGRRSIYLALIVGFVFLTIGLLFSFRRGYGRLVPVFVLGLGFLGFLYLGEGSAILPNTFFFQERVGTIEDRVRAFSGDDEVIADDDNFILLQRQGMWIGLREHPWTGIGWGGFAESRYSPTGHEMHSTPQRFLVELGLIGFTLYLIMTGYILIGSVRLFNKARGTPYQLPTLILAIALWSLHVSWAYNRSITDRTYWLLLVILMGFELVVSGVPQKLKARRPFPSSTLISQERG